jgi:hypothetical protein
MRIGKVAAISAMARWIALLSLGALSLLPLALRHTPPPELGYVGWFLIVSSLLSAFYVAFWIVLAVPAFTLLRRCNRPLGLWLVCGAVLFGASAMIVDVFALKGPSHDILYETGLAAIVGAISFGAFKLSSGRG